MVQRSLRVRHGSAVPPLFLLLSFPTPATLRPIRCLGVEVSFAESMSVDGMAAAVRPNTKLLYGGNNPGFCQLSSGVLRSPITSLTLFLETPANPTLGILDLEAFSSLGADVGALTMVGCR